MRQKKTIQEPQVIHNIIIISQVTMQNYESLKLLTILFEICLFY